MVSGNLTAESDPTGLDEKEKRPLWPYRKAARQKGLPIGIIDFNIDKDPGHTHPETFGSAADDLYTTEEEFRTLILPVLEGTHKP